MTLKILCFEDTIGDQKLLRDIFEGRGAMFLFYDDWDIASHIEEISKFKPDIVVVDLLDNKTNLEPGYRLIRRLSEIPQTSGLPVIAWSVLFREDPDGLRAQQRAKEWGARPLLKSEHTPPERFLEDS